ncbi:hypothetical protein QBC44DRAFT_367557 [Cladorrhinum sp. PSN332]|nr:hypothetical protein QBC44DRAFT_367557 [Cladorrhinum sp. PSN332]
MASQSSSPPSFKRIRLIFEDDFDAAYSVITAFIQEPQAADAVEEFIIDLPSRLGRDTRTPRGISQTPASLLTPIKFDAEAYQSLTEHAKSLGLAEDHTKDMIAALEWKRDLTLRYPNGEDQESRYNRLFYNVNPKNGNYNMTMATILISLCSNIISLRINNVRPYTVLADFLTRNNYGELPRPFLGRLEKVLVHGYQTLDPRTYSPLVSLHCFRFFHRLPSVETFSFDAVGDYQAQEAYFPSKVSAGIKKIHITHSLISGYLIGTMIRLPVALEEFSYTDGLCLWSRDAGALPVLYPKTLGKCLSEHKDTLKRLDITTHGYPSPFNDSRGDEHEINTELWEEQLESEETSRNEALCPYFEKDRDDSPKGLPLWLQDIPETQRYYPNSIGLLHDFTKLTHLSIRLGVLLGYYVHFDADCPERKQSPSPVPSVPYRLVDCLPPNLEYLKLYGYERGKYPAIDVYVDDFLHNKAERFPNLKVIEGIREHIPAEQLQSGRHWIPEEQLWERPTDGLDWLEAEPASS